MKRTLKIGLVVAIILCVAVVSGAILLLQIRPQTVEHMSDTYQGVTIQALTNKDSYATGEPINISALLTNTNNNLTSFRLYGYEYKDTHEIYAKLHVSIYDVNYTLVWSHDDPGKAEFFMFNAVPYEITIPALGTQNFDNFISWNQTANGFGVPLYNTTRYYTNQQVPAGTYYVVVKVPVNIGMDFTFGSSKTIIIL